MSEYISEKRKQMNFYDKLKRSMDLDDPRRQSVDLMEQVVSKIPTEAGRKYALSKLLNDEKYGLNDFSSFKNQEYIKDIQDAWSLKHQDDFTPPDIEKAEAKQDKEDFFNWDSKKHWSKRTPQELKQKAAKAGYADYGAYLQDVGKLQTDKDTEKELSRFGYNKWGPVFAPRTYEAYSRREDPSIKDIGLDTVEGLAYTVNPAGRAAQAGLQGSKYAAKTGALALGANALANPLILESLDAMAYNDPKNARSKFSGGDVVMGTGINIGVGKAVPSIIKKVISPVEKSRAQVAKEVAKQSVPTYDKRTISVDGTEMSRRDANEVSKFLKDEIRRKEVQNLSSEDLRLKLDKINMAKKQESAIAKETKNEAKDVATTFGERYVSDLTPGGFAMDFVSNKFGDELSEDPQATKRLVQRAVRAPGFNLAGPLIDAYYASKEGESEKKKLDRELGYE